MSDSEKTIEETNDSTVEASQETVEEKVEDKAEDKVEEKAEDKVEDKVEDKDALAAGDTPDFKWFVVKTMTGQENKVAKTLRERIINFKLTESFSQILVPEETVVSNVNGKKRRIKKKFFPGYVLVKMIMTENAWHIIVSTDKITGFVGGTKDKPQPLSDKEAEYMTNQAKEGFKKTRTSVNFTEGETVKVIEGPFASFVGTVEAVNEKGKIRVNVSIFGRPTPVELDFTQVEKVS